jgi:hypothetical protein
MRTDHGRWQRVLGLGTALALGGLGAACQGGGGNTTTQQVILEIEPGSMATISAPAGAAPAIPGAPTKIMTRLEGSITSTLDVNVNLQQALASGSVKGTLRTNSLLIAGPSTTIAPGLMTGALCTSLDPTVPATGTFEADIRAGMVKVKATANTIIQVTDPGFAMVFPALRNPVEISFSAPVALADLLGALNGAVIPIKARQMSVTTITQAVPGFQNGTLAIDLNLMSVAKAPKSQLLDQCASFIAMQGAPRAGGPIAMAPASPPAKPMR